MGLKDLPYKPNNPSTIHRISSALRQPQNHPTLDPPDLSSPRILRACDSDIFKTFPPEILVMILAHLPSKDVAHLKQASPIYATLRLPDSFWKSRFLLGNDFQHIFEIDEWWNSRSLCWRDMFLSLQASIIPLQHYRRSREFHALENGTRIWNLCFALHKLVRTVAGVSCDGIRSPIIP